MIPAHTADSARTTIPTGGCNDRHHQPGARTPSSLVLRVCTVQILGLVPGAAAIWTYNLPTSSAFVTAESSQNEACLLSAHLRSHHAIGGDALASFEATGQTDRVMITWETVSELQNAGLTSS